MGNEGVVDSPLETPPLKDLLWSSAKFLQPRPEKSMLFFQDTVSRSLFFWSYQQNESNFPWVHIEPVLAATLFFSFSKPGLPLMIFVLLLKM